MSALQYIFAGKFPMSCRRRRSARRECAIAGMSYQHGAMQRIRGSVNTVDDASPLTSSCRWPIYTTVSGWSSAKSATSATSHMACRAAWQPASDGACDHERHGDEVVVGEYLIYTADLYVCVRNLPLLSILIAALRLGIRRRRSTAGDGGSIDIRRRAYEARVPRAVARD